MRDKDEVDIKNRRLTHSQFKTYQMKKLGPWKI